MANNNYLIYGDDHRVDQEDLEALLKRAEKLLEIRKKRILKKRAKIRKKKKIPEKITMQMGEELQDVLQDPPSITGNPVTPDSLPAKKLSVNQKTGKKHATLPVIILLLLTIISIVLLAGYLVLKYNSKQSETAGEPIQMSSLASPEPASETAEPYATAAPITEGYIAPADPEKEYELGETLSIAKMINEKTSDYLDKAIREIRQYQEHPEYDYVQVLSENRARISSDLETLKDYEPVFAVYGGYSYVRAAEDRLVNAAALYNDLDKEMDDEELIRMVNRYIENENVLTENAKAALIEYLNENDVDYELTTATIKYDSLQFEKEDEGQVREGAEAGEADREESIYK